MAPNRDDLVTVRVTRQTRAQIKSYAARRGMKLPPAAAELVARAIKPPAPADSEVQS